MANVSSSNGLEKYPKLRFRGFSEPWTQVLLSDIFKKSIKKNSDGSITNVICNSARNGLIPQREYFDKSIANSDNTDGYYIIEQGDFVYNPRKSSDAPYGPVSIYKYPESGIVSPLYLCFRALKSINSSFYDYFFKSPSWHRYIYLSGDSGARHDRVSIKDDVFFSMPMYIPSEEEQLKVSSFLSLIEKRIADQQQLVEHLKKYKRGVIKEFLTPQTCPIKNAIWSKTTIGELGTFVKGAPLSKADISDEGTPFILYGELYTTYGEVINKVVRRTQKSVDNVYLSRIGDVLIPTSGETPEEISTASCVMVSDVILAGDLNIFRTSKVDGRIMSYVLNHIVNSNIARIAQGKSVVHIQASEISKISISYPDENTQQQLISIFDGISEKITLVEKSLAKLILLKKSLIQKIFI